MQPNMRRMLLLLLPLAFGGVTASAQEAEPNEKIVDLKVEARLDWQGDWDDFHVDNSKTGFAGKYLNIRLDGNITDNLSYSWRQRLNKPHKDASFFDATDWLYLQYDLQRWQFAGGKQIVAIGGWEYDRPPIDTYYGSVFWNNIPCYDIGASVGFKAASSDKLTFQFCQSPFHTSDFHNMYAYNLMWTGSHGCFDALWSVNMIEYVPGKFINYIALGNKFRFDKLSVELDLMNRAASGQTFLFKDCSVMGEVSYRPTGRWNIFGKYTYDVNHSGTGADATVLDGTEMNMAGAGVEFIPFANSRHTLSVHAAAFYSWGCNTNTADLMQDKSLVGCVGVKWTMNLLSLRRK